MLLGFGETHIEIGSKGVQASGQYNGVILPAKYNSFYIKNY